VIEAKSVEVEVLRMETMIKHETQVHQAEPTTEVHTEEVKSGEVHTETVN
jgi:hypothetical protein